ncbi:MAG: peptidoglycan-binding domain-containing protein [Actinomycetia bacterium]|nr:peptidoglycan-binding domain-containing protein [Actinomycetes bacterium]
MVDIIGRSVWGARAPRSRIEIPTPTPELWLHHSAGSERGEIGVRSIQNFHMDFRGWTDIAYSFLIDRVTFAIYEGRGPGVRGGHTLDHNGISHGICVMGNFENDPVPTGLVRQVAALVRHGHGQGWWPETLTGGHRDIRPTACPGDNLHVQIDEINRLAVINEEVDEMILRKGAKGKAITMLQEGLLGWNATALPQFGADGDFGDETEVWVRAFQTAQDLAVSGAIDGVTASLILEFRTDGDDSA